MSQVFVIAEAAATHDGDLTKALRLIDLAREIRADAVKFQWLSSPERLAERRRATEYLNAYRTLAFPREWFPTLVARCSQPRNDLPWPMDSPGKIRVIPPVEFMCTTYLESDIAVVAPWVTRFKIASFEAEDEPFVVAHGPYDRETLISLGMNAKPYFGPRVRFARYLLCTSAYPAPIDEMNLARLRYADGVPISGLSDTRATHGWARWPLPPGRGSSSSTFALTTPTRRTRTTG